MKWLANSVLAALCWDADIEQSRDDKLNDNIIYRIGILTGIKTFPVVAGHVIALLNKPDFTVDEIADTIRKDPALAAGVLRLANSAFFSPSRRVVTLDQAFIRLGRDTVQEVVFAVATMKMFPSSYGPAKAIRDHCAATAAISHAIAEYLETTNKEIMFLSGLMHDIGKMLIIDSGELSYCEKTLLETMQSDVSHSYEREKLGFDHAILAGQVLSKWKLDNQIVNIVAWHHLESLAYTDPKVGPSVAILRIADQIETHLSFPIKTKEDFITDMKSSADWNFLQPNDNFLDEIWETLVSSRDSALTLFAG